jgi:hypothetical protein
MLALLTVLVLMQPVPSGVVTVAQGAYSGIEERTENLIRTASDWQALWKAHRGSGPAPPVDFAKETIAAVFLGTRPTGGYSIEIVRARRDGTALVLEYVERRPAADSIVTQALTSPFHIVKLPKHDGPASFHNVSPAPSPR